MVADEGGDEAGAVPLPDCEVGPPVSDGLVDGGTLDPELGADAEAGALGAAVPALLVATAVDADGLGVSAVDGPAAAALLLAVGGCRICAICRSYWCSCARISVRLSEVMCRLKARICVHRAASRAAVTPCGAVGSERSSWIASAAVTQLMQL